MLKSALILLLAVGYSLQTPVEVEDVPNVSTTDAQGTTTEAQVTTTEEELQTEAPETEEPEIESFPDGECPETDGTFPVFLTDLKNCSVFYQCANGYPYRLVCSYPLEFNPTLNVCDFPGLSGCINDKRAPFRMIGRCPPNMRPGMTKLLRDSEDNTIYYECVAGEPVLRKCPEGTIFTFKRVCEPPTA